MILLVLRLILVLLVLNRILRLLRLLGILLYRRSLTGRSRIGRGTCRSRSHALVYRSGSPGVTYGCEISVRCCRIHALRAIIFVTTGHRCKNCQYNH